MKKIKFGTKKAVVSGIINDGVRASTFGSCGNTRLISIKK